MKIEIEMEIKRDEKIGVYKKMMKNEEKQKDEK